MPRTSRWQSITTTLRYGIAGRFRAQRERPNDQAARARWPPTNQLGRHRPQRNQSHTAGWLLSSDRQNIISRRGKQAISSVAKSVRGDSGNNDHAQSIRLPGILLMTWLLVR